MDISKWTFRFGSRQEEEEEEEEERRERAAGLKSKGAAGARRTRAKDERLSER